MRYWLLLLCIIVSYPALVAAQDPKDDNRKPQIRGQREISTNEEQPVTLQLTDLQVRDRDDWFYPWGFTLTVYPGSNYTLNTHTVTPAPNFTGTLSVPVTVNDGEEDSEPFNVQIQVRPVNDVPVISGQGSISTHEDQPLTVQASHLTIVDPDDNQFSIEVSAGANYTASGATITPALNFSGMLTIPVRVNDGEAYSNFYNLQLPVHAVNDAPLITGQQPLEGEENQFFTVQLTHLQVTDPDNSYPAGFTLTILPSPNNSYTVSGNQVKPALNFEGMLQVSVRVNDGAANSEPYLLQVKINPGKNGPTITGQAALTTNEDLPITLQMSHVTVSDPDNTYPTGFTFRILAGTNYTSSGMVVTPAADFHGSLAVSVVVNDGTSDSAPFPLMVTVRPVNDAPKISKIETEPLGYAVGKGPAPITQMLEITDADDDSLTQAEISFRPGTYRPGIDELAFKTGGRIAGTFDRQRGVLLLAGIAPLADYEKAIRNVTYNFVTADIPFENKALLIAVSDGRVMSEKAERQIRASDIVVDLDIPTAFTPNGDLANDTWSIRPLRHSEELDKAVVRVYNKRGYLLFEAVGLEKEWDGRLNGEVLPADTYYYTIDFDLQYTRKSFKGIVAILR